MTYTVAIDPGTTKSAWVVIDDLLKPVAWAWEDNNEVLKRHYENGAGELYWSMPNPHKDIPLNSPVIEDVANMGQAVGSDVFETVKWIGRFDYRQTARFITRNEVKLHVCGSARGVSDANIRQAAIDRYGGKDKAIGGRKCQLCKGKGWRGRHHDPCPEWETKPGVLYDFSKAGMSSHGWSALALALTAVGS